MTKASLTLAKVPVYPYLESKDAARVTERKILGDQGLVGSNATSSLADEALSAYRKSHLTAVEKRELKDWKFVLNKSKDGIHLHFDKRVYQLFMQAVLCYNTDYEFREGHTVHQGFGAHHLEELKFNAAHRATIPCLYARCRSTNKEIVFLYRSGFYDESNETGDLIKEVNDADRAIDEKTKTSLLRKKTVTLLNRDSKGELSPPQVAKLFIAELLEEIDKASLKETDHVKDVLKIYRSRAEDLITYVDHPENIDRWLNLRIDDPIFISKDLTYRGLIKNKIDALPIVIHNERHQKENESHIPAHFLDLYHHKVLSKFDGEQLKTIEKAIGIKFEDLDEEVNQFVNTKRTNALLRKHAKKIDQLKNELIPLIAEKQNQPVKKEHLSLSNSKKICLRPSMYHLRYQMISNDQEAQSTIKSKLENTLNKVKNGSSAHHFDDFFYHAALNETKTPSDRLLLAKLLSVSPVALDQKIREIKVNEQAHKKIKCYTGDLSRIASTISENTTLQELEDKVRYFIDQMVSSCRTDWSTLKDLCYRRLYDEVEPDDEKYLKNLIGSKKTIDLRIGEKMHLRPAEELIGQKIHKIKKVVEAVFEEIADLNGKTEKFKSELLLELRKANGMKQDYFVNAYNRKNPARSMNVARLIDLEKGRDVLTPEITKQVAKIYGLSDSLFYPSHFAAAEA
jgi:hypothetical protein